MRVKCLNCGLVLEKCLSLECVCPKCGRSNWCVIFEGSEDTMMGLTMKARDKFNKESLEIMLETYNMAKNWLEEKGYMTFEKMGVPDKTVKDDTRKYAIKFLKNRIKEEEEKEHNWKYEMENCLFYIEEGKKNKEMIMALRCLLQQINKDYRDFIERHLLADLPIDPIEFSNFYQAQLERIMNIKI